MPEPYLGEIRRFGFDFAPAGWAKCDGQLLQINDYQALFSLLGTNYGGDGETTFGLPDLRGRVATHWTSGSPLGRKGGEATHVLTAAEMPPHDHVLRASSAPGTETTAAGNRLASSVGANAYAVATNPVTMAPGALANAGGGQSHENRQPYLVINFCIALTGVFPPVS